MRKVKFEVKQNEIEIITLADVHYGNEQFDLTFFTNFMAYCYEHKNVYLVLNGDLIEGTIKNSPASIFAQSTYSIQEQIAFIVEALKPIAEEHRIISITGGNHDSDRQMKEVGICPTDMIVSLLSQYDTTLPERYNQDCSGCYDFILVPHRNKSTRSNLTTFTLFHQHSTGGGTTKQGKVAKSIRVRDMINAMIVITSHGHDPDFFPMPYYEVNHKDCDVKEIEGWNVISNAFLKNGGGYATKSGMRPVSRNVPIITLKAKRKFYYEGKQQKEYIDKIISVRWKTVREFEEGV